MHSRAAPLQSDTLLHTLLEITRDSTSKFRSAVWDKALQLHSRHQELHCATKFSHEYSQDNPIAILHTSTTLPENKSKCHVHHFLHENVDVRSVLAKLSSSRVHQELSIVWMCRELYSRHSHCSIQHFWRASEKYLATLRIHFAVRSETAL